MPWNEETEPAREADALAATAESAPIPGRSAVSCPRRSCRTWVLKSGAQRGAEYADGRKESVGVTEPLIVEFLRRDTLEEALVLGDEVLIGSTVLEKLDLLADCANQRLVPNPAHPSQPVTKIR